MLKSSMEVLLTTNINFFKAYFKVMSMHIAYCNIYKVKTTLNSRKGKLIIRIIQQ